MKYDPNIHHRRSIRLKGYDYSQIGAYFITICVNQRSPLLSQICDRKIIPSESGQMVQTIWNELSLHYPGVATDVFALMPDHIHGIIQLTKANAQSMTLGDVVHRFKSLTTAKYRHGVNELGWQPFINRLWQRNYYEKILVNEQQIETIRHYILNNPLLWESEPSHIGKYHPQP